MDAHPEIEAFMAFPEETADQLEHGYTEIAPVAAVIAPMIGARPCFLNAAEKAGR